MKFKALKPLTVKDGKELITLQKDEVRELSDKFVSNPYLEAVEEKEEPKVNPATKKVVKKTTKKK